MGNLSVLQQRFAVCVAKLILHINDTPGYSCALGEAKRSDEQAEINSIGSEGRAKVARLIEPFFPGLARAILNNGKASGVRLSVHQNKLAIDIDLFKDGVYQPNTESHAQFGAFWKTLDPEARWGGDFKPRPDGNHYSFEFCGVK